jgi:L-asparaginase II
MTRPQAARSMQSEGPSAAPSPNPVLTRVWRGAHVESQHRGAWVLVDSAGNVLDGAGESFQAVFARSSIKSLQALPLCETGAAERLGYGDDELALALASHDGEPIHTERVERLLQRLGLGAEHLQCGPQPPGSSSARDALRSAGRAPSALHNNCSETQRLVRQAVEEMSGCSGAELSTAVDGCSAPTFRLPLAKLATAIARVSNPDGLGRERRAACEWMQRSVAAHPELIAGTRKRLCTDLARASGGRLFPKIGGEAVYLIGAVGRDRGLAIKVDDGSYRGFQALILELCARWGWLDAAQVAGLEAWRERTLVNWAGHPVGRVEVVA